MTGSGALIRGLQFQSAEQSTGKRLGCSRQSDQSGQKNKSNVWMLVKGSAGSRWKKRPF